MTIRASLAVAGSCVTLLAASASAVGADAAAGKSTFRQQCALCHTAEPNDNGGAEGPALTRAFGSPAASNPTFGAYTQALRDSHLTWDARTLDRFLKAPTTVVPGSKMVIPVANKADRKNVIAYLQSVKSTAPGAGPGGPPAVAAAAPKGEAEWKKDTPGRAYRIDLAHLAPPFDTPGARNFPRFIERPADAQLAVPPGFKVDTFASKLQGPRRMIVASNGDVLVTETTGGRVSVLHPSKDNASAASTDVFVSGLKQPFGIAFYPDAQNPQWLYVGETNRVVRYAYKTGDVKASDAPEIIVPELPGGGGHFTRDIAFSLDGKRLFVSVGSASNVAEDMSKKSAADAKAWEAEHGLGAAWDKETNRAVVLAYEVGSGKPGKIFASGIRNCVGLTVHPKTGDLWCTTNERDMLGDDLVPDYSTRVKEGGYYGWPWYYMGSNEEPRLKGDRPDLLGKALLPDVPYQAHSAALTLIFYTATSGSSAFPAEYVGDGFAVFHGSWNRGFRTGHKIVRVRMKDGVPTGEYDDFLTGFIVNDGNAWGRPVATTVMRDGSMLLSDDGSNLIYRISYSH